LKFEKAILDVVLKDIGNYELLIIRYWSLWWC